MINIPLKEAQGTHLISLDAGAEIGTAALEGLRAGNNTVTLDASNIVVICSSFLVGLLGTLYRELPTESVSKHLALANATQLMQQTFHLVQSHMERYFADPAYRQACDQFERENDAA